MRRGDVVVLSISSVLALIAVAAITFSVRVLDRTPATVEFEPVDTSSTWLVMTWGPSLCRAEPNSPGCKSGQVEKLGATWILHGLWPQPAENQYCGVPKGLMDRARDIRRSDLPPVEIGDDLRASLQSMMSDASIMAPHEWYAHGTCSGVTPDVFFGDAVTLVEEARTVLDPMFADAQEGRIQLSDVQHKFNETYGAGAGDRIRLSCRNMTGHGSLAYELHLSLPPVSDLRALDSTLALKDLIVKAPPIAPGCMHASVP
jgi:ribonuclease T2